MLVVNYVQFIKLKANVCIILTCTLKVINSKAAFQRGFRFVLMWTWTALPSAAQHTCAPNDAPEIFYQRFSKVPTRLYQLKLSMLYLCVTAKLQL